MGWKIIGSCWEGLLSQDNKYWRIKIAEVGRSYLRIVVGKEPPLCELKIVQGQHSEMSIGIDWSYMEPEPEVYIAKCQAALSRLNDAIDWSQLQNVENDLAEIDEEFET